MQQMNRHTHTHTNCHGKQMVKTEKMPVTNICATINAVHSILCGEIRSVNEFGDSFGECKRNHGDKIVNMRLNMRIFIFFRHNEY